MQFLFNSKDEVQHLSCIIYKGVCSCDADYIGDTISNVNIRWNEHERGIDKNSEYTKHFLEHFNDEFQCLLLSIAPRKRIKENETFPKLSGEHRCSGNVLTLFREGIT